VANLIRAGFFYSGAGRVVTCFYCNGLLQDWSAEDDPVEKHARSFPQCAYIKQLCGENSYRKFKKQIKSTKVINDKHIRR